MPFERVEVERLLDQFLIYLPRPQARQLLCDVKNSRAAQHSRDLHDAARLMVEALDRREGVKT